MVPEDVPAQEVEQGDGPQVWQDVLLTPLHRFSPDAFEELSCRCCVSTVCNRRESGGQATSASTELEQHRLAQPFRAADGCASCGGFGLSCLPGT